MIFVLVFFIYWTYSFGEERISNSRREKSKILLPFTTGNFMLMEYQSWYPSIGLKEIIFLQRYARSKFISRGGEREQQSARQFGKIVLKQGKTHATEKLLDCQLLPSTSSSICLLLTWLWLPEFITFHLHWGP